MRKRLLGTTLLALFVSVQSAWPCGDKFLISSRGTRYQRAPGLRAPASILLYVPKPLEIAPSDAVLQKAGYRPVTVSTRAEFDSALSRGGWDLVVVSLPDAESLRGRTPAGTLVLPVVPSVAAANLKEARRLYPVIVGASAKSGVVLEAVDRVLASRPKPQGKSQPGI